MPLPKSLGKLNQCRGPARRGVVDQKHAVGVRRYTGQQLSCVKLRAGIAGEENQPGLLRPLLGNPTRTPSATGKWPNPSAV